MLLIWTAWLLAGFAGTRPAEYDMHVVLQPSARTMRVSGTLRLPATRHPRDSLRLLIWSGARDVHFSLDSPQRAIRVSTDSADGDRSWFIHFASPLPSGHDAVVRFSYRADSASSAQIRVTPSVAYAGGGGEIWYPRLGFDSAATGTVRFIVPPGHVVVATGSLRSTAAEQAAGRFSFEVKEPSKIGFAAGRYSVTSAEGVVPVRLYLLRPRTEADTMVARAARTLGELYRLFGPLPLSSYAIVEVEFGGGVGGTSEYGFFLADRSRLDEGFSVPFFGHEMAHAWWGNLIRSRPGTAGRMMLSEGIAQFAMLRVLARLEGEQAAERFRRSEYPGSSVGGSTNEYFRLASAGLELPLTAFEPKGADVLRMHRMANTRGFMLLDMLANELGGERFARMLRNFVETHRSEPTSWQAFEAAVSRASGRDMRWFFDQWLKRAGAPELRLDYSRRGRLIRGTISHLDTTYSVAVEIEARGRQNSAIRSIPVRGRSTSFEWSLPFDPDTVLLDPRFRVLRWTQESRNMAVALAAFTRADWQRRFGNRARSIELYRVALDSIIRPDKVGAEFLLRFGLARALNSDRRADAARAQLDSALLAPTRLAEQVPFVFLEIARASAAANDSLGLRRAIAALEAAEAALESRTGASAQAKALIAW